MYIEMGGDGIAKGRGRYRDKAIKKRYSCANILAHPPLKGDAD